MSRRSSAHVLRSFVLLGALACQRPDFARIELERDDFVLYGNEPFELPVRVVDRDGGTRPRRELKLRVVLGSVVRVLQENSAVVCKGAGTAQVELQAGALRESITVKCRPIDSIRALRNIELTVGDPPRPVVLQARFESGEAEVMRPLSLTTGNDDVAVMRGDSVLAVAPGQTTLFVELGGRSVRLGVFVSAVIADETLSLRAGEFRNWVLEPGRYAMTIEPVQPRHDRRWLDLVTEGTRCLRSLRVKSTVTCVVYERGAVIVRNTGAGVAGRDGRAFVRIVQTP